MKGVDHRHQRRRAVDHGRVDHLALTRTRRLQEGGHHPERQQHSATAEVTDQVEWRHRRGVGASEPPQRARDGDVVDVVARGVGHRAVLTPARHAAIDQGAVAGPHLVGTDPEALGHPGTEALDQSVGLLGKGEHQLDRVGILQINADRRAGSIEQVPVPGRGRRTLFDRTPWGAFEADDLGSCVGQHHGGVRCRPDAREFDDLDAVQRAFSWCFALRHRRIVTRATPRGQAGPMRTARAPGRVTLIGDHTDYNEGLSLPIAVDLFTEATFSEQADSFFFGLSSDQFDEPWEIPLPNDPHESVSRTHINPPEAALATALVALLAPPAGGHFRVTSTVPVGAGLASSAAFSVALALALGHERDALALARLDQRAEAASGAHVGLLDPIAIVDATRGARLLHRLREPHPRAPPGLDSRHWRVHDH